MAVSNGSADIVEFLLNPGPHHTPADVNRVDTREMQSALVKATLNNQPDCVAVLLAYDADPLLSTKSNWTPLYVAANKGSIEIVNQLLDLVNFGAFIDIPSTAGTTALAIACTQGHYEVVELLLLKGANVNVSDEQSSTPLMKAAAKGFTQIANLLVKYGADVNAQDKQGYTAIIRAADSGHTEIVELLMQSDASVSAVNNVPG